MSQTGTDALEGLDTVNAPALVDAIIHMVEQLLQEKNDHGQIRPMTRAHTRYWLVGQIAASFWQLPPTLEGETASIPPAAPAPEEEPPFTFRGWSGYVCETAVEGVTDQNGINGEGAYTFEESREEVGRRGNVRIEIGDGVTHEELPQLLANLYHRVMQDLGLNVEGAETDQGEDED